MKKIYFLITLVSLCFSCSGEDGIDGLQGVQSEQGAAGADGWEGVQGETGTANYIIPIGSLQSLEVCLPQSNQNSCSLHWGSAILTLLGILW